MISLDTHILVFALTGQLKPREREQLARSQWGISAIVLWELAVLCRLGRIDVDFHSAEFARALGNILIWPIDLSVCRTLSELDFRSDPADEIIAATSLVHNVPLLTRDRRIRTSKIVQFV